MVQISMLGVSAALLLVGASLGLRNRRKARSGSESCSSIGCGTAYNRSQACQCNDNCARYGNCCADHGSLCDGGEAPAPSPAPSPPATSPPAPSPGGKQCNRIGCGAAYNRSHWCQCNNGCRQYDNCCADYGDECESTPSPTPAGPPGAGPPAGPGTPSAKASKFWEGVDMRSTYDMQTRLKRGAKKLSYGDLWNFYKVGWSDLPGQCQGSIFDVYSKKCWTKGTEQCGNYKGEGDCYNREHSWPKSWWGGSKIAAYSDVFHVMPSDGYVNGKRSAHPFGEVRSPSWTSSEGNKVGPCRSGGGTCFEPTDRVKGLMARGHLYMAVRYMNEISHLNRGSSTLMRQWNSAFPPAAWEREFNDRAQGWQKNRNPFIDFPQLANEVFR